MGDGTVKTWQNGGKMSQYMHNLKIGDKVLVSGEEDVLRLDIKY
jgi:Na+-transporting NADH:ubiquinone oxidoreductase subunit NqrF